MALGTTTLITSGGADSGQVNVDRFTVVLDASYPTGGYTGLAAKLTAAASRYLRLPNARGVGVACALIPMLVACVFALIV